MQTIFVSGFSLEILDHGRLQKLVGCLEEILLDLKDRPIFRQVATNTDDTVHLLPADQVGHLLIKQLRQHTRLEYVGEDQRAFLVFPFLAALQEIERNIQRVDIRIISIVNEQAVVNALLHVKTHIDRLQLRELGIEASSVKGIVTVRVNPNSVQWITVSFFPF